MPPPKQKLSVTFRASDKGRGRVGLALTVVDAVRVWPPRAPPVTAARAAQCQGDAFSRGSHTHRFTNSCVTLRAGRHDKLTSSHDWRDRTIRVHGAPVGHQPDTLGPAILTPWRRWIVAQQYV